MTEDNIIDPEVIEHLRAQGCQPRKHAPHFSWHDRSAQGKGLAEAGVVDNLLAAMSAEGHAQYQNLGPSGEQWPDVWIQGHAGERIPYEVAELVDQAALPAGSP